MKTAAIIQPGRLGDIIICLPIAKFYYDLGYTVKWPVVREYFSIFDNIDYVEPIALECGIMESAPAAYNTIDPDDLVIDLCFGFPGSRVSFAFMNKTFGSTFVESKYSLAKVPFSERNKLVYRRNERKENELYDIVVGDLQNYTVFHIETSCGVLNAFDSSSVTNPVFVRKIDGYNLFDWYKILFGANKIYCIDSALCNYLEGDKCFEVKEKIHNGIRQSEPWLKNTLNNGWKFSPIGMML